MNESEQEEFDDLKQEVDRISRQLSHLTKSVGYLINSISGKKVVPVPGDDFPVTSDDPVH